MKSMLGGKKEKSSKEADVGTEAGGEAAEAEMPTEPGPDAEAENDSHEKPEKQVHYAEQPRSQLSNSQKHRESVDKKVPQPQVEGDDDNRKRGVDTPEERVSTDKIRTQETTNGTDVREDKLPSFLGVAIFGLDQG